MYEMSPPERESSDGKSQDVAQRDLHATQPTEVTGETLCGISQVFWELLNVQV